MLHVHTYMKGNKLLFCHISIWYVSKLITIMNPNIMSHFNFWSIRKKEKRYDVELVQLESLTKSLIPIMGFIQISLLHFDVSVNLMIKLLIKIINPWILNLRQIKSCVRIHQQQQKSYVRIFHLSATNLITKGEYFFHHIINNFNVPLISYISCDWIILLKRKNIWFVINVMMIVNCSCWKLKS